MAGAVTRDNKKTGHQGWPFNGLRQQAALPAPSSAVITAAPVIGPTAIIAGAAIIGRASIIIVVVGPAVLGCGDRKTGADDARESGCCGGAARPSAIMDNTTSAEVGGSACDRGRGQSVPGFALVGSGKRGFDGRERYRRDCRHGHAAAKL